MFRGKCQGWSKVLQACGKLGHEKPVDWLLPSDLGSRSTYRKGCVPGRSNLCSFDSPGVPLSQRGGSWNDLCKKYSLLAPVITRGLQTSNSHR
ncbi:hypothetical protein U0070_016830 [Myodes glareolus]|uniref:Uncharacterized protein n=1 Tax=Myodes glareolus TaxID=447135 RepID=A0AAW0IBF0_MYOGA